MLRRVHVHQAVAEVRGKPVFSTPKSHERRSVPFPAFLADELAALVVGKRRDDLVFTNALGGVLRVSKWATACTGIGCAAAGADRAGLPCRDNR